jgi:hypothetical protein
VYKKKNELIDASNAIHKMKEEHEEYETERRIGGEESRSSLKVLINTQIKKPVRGTEYGILLPTYYY